MTLNVTETLGFDILLYPLISLVNTLIFMTAGPETFHSTEEENKEYLVINGLIRLPVAL